MKIAPANIQVIGSEVAIAWNDGQETYVQLEKLRLQCPCATCSGEPDAMGRVYKPKVTYNAATSFQIRTWGLVGGYAWQPTWQDGHSTGLYTFEYLRRMDSL